MKRVLVSVMLAILFLATPSSTADAGAEWCEYDPLLVVRTPGGASVPLFVTTGAEGVEHLSALLTGAWERIDAVEPRTARAAAGIVATYVQWHLERAVRSLNLVERS